MQSRIGRARIDRPGERVLIEPLEPRRLLSAALSGPLAQTLLQASPADASLSDGMATPPSNAYTPAQIRSAYGISNIKLNGVVGDGTGQTIAIVTADDDPNLVSSSNSNFDKSDLHIFDEEFGLPDPPAFTKIEQSASNTPDTGWSEEAALDVEWSHVIAPEAKIILVEASGDGAGQLIGYGIATAARQPGVSVVSDSWLFSEFSSETSYDDVFTTPSGHNGVTFVTSTGDTGAPSGYPAYSPNELAVGGTKLTISGDSYSGETAYSGSGGGASAYENKPAYQADVPQSLIERTVPDVSFEADPTAGVAVYDSYNGGYPGWYKLGGTSLAAPAWAGLIAIADQGRAAAGEGTLDGPSQTLPKLYALPSSDFHDITSGNNGYPAGPGYDLVTGLGSPIANLLVPAVAGVSSGATTNTASISGTVFNDTNNNGKLDSGEAGIAGVELYIDNNKTGVLASGDPTTTTSSSGSFAFTKLAAGTYEVREVVPSGYKLTSPSSGYFSITVSTGGTVSGENFANVVVPKLGSIAGTVYVDSNDNGKLDSGEAGLSGVKIFMDINKNAVLDSGEPEYPVSSNGVFKFNGIPAGTYEIREIVPSGYQLTNPSTGLLTVTLTAGQVLTGVNFGNAKIIATISGYAYVDTNSDGKLDNGEKGLSGVTLFLDTNSNGKLDSGEVSVTTSSAGYYSFSFISAGTYRLAEVLPSGDHLTNPKAGFFSVVVKAGTSVTNEDWGNLK